MRRPLLGACLLFVCAIWIYYLCVPYTLPDYNKLEGNVVYASGTVAAIETEQYYGKQKVVYTLKDVELKTSMADDRENLYQHNRIYCYTLENFKDVYIGTKIAVKGDFSSFKGAENPGAFDSKFYYHILDAGAEIKDAQLIFANDAVFPVRNALHQLRTFFLTKTDILFSQPYAGVIEAILFGYKGNLDSNIKQLYKEGGMLHIMTISGMHISMLGMGCFGFLRRLKCPIKVSAVAGMVVVILYVVMIDAKASAIRAVFMLGMQMIAKIRGRTYDSLTALGLSATILLLRQPMYLFSSGFLLSYGSVLGIIVVTPVLTKLLKSQKKFINQMISRLGASVGIMLVTLPIQLYFFYEYPLYSILINFVVLPLLPCLIGLALFALVIPDAFGWLQRIVVFVDEKILSFYEWICTFFGDMPHHTLIAGTPRIWQIGLYYGCLVVVMVLLSISVEDRKKRIRRAITAGFLILCAMAMLFWRNEKGLKCHFLSVGQGDAAVFQCDGKTYIIDCGSSSQKNVAKNILIPFLKYQGIRKVDGVFLSHADLDHMIGVIEWLEMYEESHIAIGCVILPGLGRVGSETGVDMGNLQEEFGEVLALCKLYDIPILTAFAGDKLSLGALQLEVLNPDAEATDSNEQSQVLLWEYKGQRILTTGDIGSKTELELLDDLYGKSITILKVAHHGSKYSSSEVFLNVVKPKISILSYGVGNSYGHPHEETLERLRGKGSLILETAKCGAVTICVDDEMKIKYSRQLK